MTPALEMRRFGPVIAERRLIVQGAPKKVVTVSLGAPRLPKGKTDWECPFRIKGAGLAILEFGYGVDAMQAVTTALDGIRALLDKTGLSLSWEDGIPGETGFQRSIPVVLGSAFARRLERLVDKEIKREVQLIERRGPR